MARARNIKPGFFRNADLVELTMEARLLFIGLWTLADREGRLDDRPKQIKMEIFPADAVDCDALLSGLAATGMVARYEVDGKRYLQVVNFTRHQNPHRDEKPSTIPDACGNLTCKAVAPAKNSASPAPVSLEESTGTAQAQCLHGAGTVAIGLNPDSLIPDSLIPDSLIPDSPTKGEGLPVQPPNVPDVPARPSMAGAICVAMKAAGMASVNPQHPELLVLIDKGADIGMFVGVARECAGKQKNFAYALAVVKGRMADAAALADTALAVPQASGAGGTETAYQRSMRERYEEATGTGPARLATPIATVDCSANFLEIAS